MQSYRFSLALQQAATSVTAEMAIYNRVGGWLQGRREDYMFHTAQIEAWIEQSGDGAK